MFAELLADGAPGRAPDGAVIALLVAAQRPEAVRSLTVSEPGCLRVAAGSPDVDEMIANGERLFSHASSIPSEDFLRLFRGGAGSAFGTPDELPDELLHGVELLKRERPPGRPRSRSSDWPAPRFPVLVRPEDTRRPSRRSATRSRIAGGRAGGDPGARAHHPLDRGAVQRTPRVVLSPPPRGPELVLFGVTAPPKPGPHIRPRKPQTASAISADAGKNRWPTVTRWMARPDWQLAGGLMSAPPRFSHRQRKRVLRYAVIGNGLPLAVATATDFSSHHTVFFVGAVGALLAPIGVTVFSRERSPVGLLTQPASVDAGADDDAGLHRRCRIRLFDS